MDKFILFILIIFVGLLITLFLYIVEIEDRLDRITELDQKLQILPQR